MSKWIFGILVVLVGLTVACGGPSEEEQVRTPMVVDAAPTCPSDAERQYFADLGGIMRSIGATVSLMSDDLAKVDRDPALVFDELWAMGATNYMHGTSHLADTIFDLDAPPAAASVQQAAEQMANRIKAAMDLFEQGIENFDVAALDEGNVSLALAGNDTQHITGLITTFC